jgi:hypothetical protein
LEHERISCSLPAFVLNKPKELLSQALPQRVPPYPNTATDSIFCGRLGKNGCASYENRVKLKGTESWANQRINVQANKKALPVSETE